MSPLYEFVCHKCANRWDTIVPAGSDSDKCIECGGIGHRTITAPGGYNIQGNNGASTKPKGAGSFKRGEKKE